MNNSNGSSENYIEEDEIDLRELWATILKGKMIIALISILVVTITLVYALKLPNVYKSEVVLIPTGGSSSASLAGLGGLASMAGIDLGGGSMTPDVAFNALLNNYEFMKEFVVNNRLDIYYSDASRDKDYVFALGFRGVYDLFKSSPKKEEEEGEDEDEKVFKIIKDIQSATSISADKKSGLITVSYSDSDRKISPIIVKAFLKDTSAYLVKNNLRIIDRKLGYFKKELQKSDGYELRQSISGVVSGILKEKVMMQSKKYYQCDVLTTAFVPYIKDKTKPKRSLILVVSFVTSIILGVFLVFFLEFIRKDKDTTPEPHHKSS